MLAGEAFSATIGDFILARVQIEDRGHSTPCWIWQRWTNEKGYGVTVVQGGAKVRVHRASYEAFKGPIPCWLETDHLCCIPSCVNPGHLEPVTPWENRRRQAIRRGEIPASWSGPKMPRTHCPNGHKYPADSQPGGKFRCTICARARRSRELAAARKARGGGATSSSGHVRTDGTSLTHSEGRQ